MVMATTPLPTATALALVGSSLSKVMIKVLVCGARTFPTGSFYTAGYPSEARCARVIASLDSERFRSAPISRPLSGRLRCREIASLIGIARRPAIVNPHVSAVGPTQLLQRLQEGCDVALRARVVPVAAALKHCDAPHPLALLRPRRERPRSRCPAEQRDEVATRHSITSSAATSSLSGTVRPSIRAVW